MTDSNNTVICNVGTELVQLNGTITDESLVYGDAISILFNNINNAVITMDSRLDFFYLDKKSLHLYLNSGKKARSKC